MGEKANKLISRRSFSRALVIGLVSIVVFFVLPLQIYDKTPRHCAVIDAGSSGSRLFLFTSEEVNPFSITQLPASHDVMPGISHFEQNPEEAAASLVPLFTFLNSQIPPESRKETAVYLKATAGMRLLPPANAARILDSIKSHADEMYDFQFHSPAIIDGWEEAYYAWLAVNTHLGSMDDPVGVLDLGGASSQIAFLHKGDSIHHQTVKASGSSYQLFRFSFLGYGVKEAHQRLLEILADRYSVRHFEDTSVIPKSVVYDPCLPRGYSGWYPAHFSPNRSYFVRGSPDYSECKKLVGMLVDDSTAGTNGKPWMNDKTLTGPLTIDIPKYPRPRFLSLDNLVKVVDIMGIPIDSTLTEIDVAARTFCKEHTWESLQKLHIDQDKTWHLKKYKNLCFIAPYGVELFHSGYGIGMDSRDVRYPRKINDIDVTWTLGAAVHELSK